MIPIQFLRIKKAQKVDQSVEQKYGYVSIIEKTSSYNQLRPAKNNSVKPKNNSVKPKKQFC